MGVALELLNFSGVPLHAAGILGRVGWTELDTPHPESVFAQTLDYRIDHCWYPYSRRCCRESLVIIGQAP